MRGIIRTDADREKFIEAIRKIDLKKPYQGTFVQVRKKRSLNQNRLLHQWFNCLEDETGTSLEVWKQYYKEKFLTTYCDIVNGTEVKTVRGTHELNTLEFTKFLEQVNLDAAEQGYYLPWPDDFGYDEFEMRYGRQ